MANSTEYSVWRYVKRFIVSLILLILVLLFLVWRIDQSRMETYRLKIAESLPDFSNFFAPITNLGSAVVRFQSYSQLLKENKELRQKLRVSDQWREAALQLEQTNAELRALNNLKFAKKVNFITGEIKADIGGNFSHSALVNIGLDKGVRVGAPALDSLGLVGRVVGVGQDNSRILLITDPQSQISVTIMPDRIRGIISGNGTANLDLTLIDTNKRLLAGARVVTSGDGILPSELLIGQIELNSEGKASVRIAADYDALEFVRVILDDSDPNIDDDVPLVLRSDTDDGEDTTNE